MSRRCASDPDLRVAFQALNVPHFCVLRQELPAGTPIASILDEVILDPEKVKAGHPLMLSMTVDELEKETGAQLSTGEKATHSISARDKIYLMGCCAFKFKYSALATVRMYEKGASIKAESEALFGVRTRMDTVVEDTGEKVVVEELFTVLFTPLFIPGKAVLEQGAAAHREMLSKLEETFS